VKSTASISGKVFTGDKQLIKGYVKSLGPKAYCKLDSAGNYSLPKVYRGHDRKVTAVYWIMENGKKKKYKQIKVIDFFNGDLTGFNFGVEATPTPTATETPTATPTQPFLHPLNPVYDNRFVEVMYQYGIWEKESGNATAIQNTINWLNGGSDLPVPENIVGADMDQNDNNYIWIYFDDGMGICMDCRDNSIQEEETPAQSNKQIKNNQRPLLKNIKQRVGTVGSNKILLLSSYASEGDALEYDNAIDANTTVYKKISEDLINSGYDVHSIKTGGPLTTEDISFTGLSSISEAMPENIMFPEKYLDNLKTRLILLNLYSNDNHYYNVEKIMEVARQIANQYFENSFVFRQTLYDAGLDFMDVEEIYRYRTFDPYYPPEDLVNSYYKLVTMSINHREKFITINDFLNLDKYGIIYISCHGATDFIAPIAYCENDEITNQWLVEHKNERHTPRYNPSGTWIPLYLKGQKDYFFYKMICLHSNFFKKQHYNNSLIYINACHSWQGNLRYTFINNGAKAYVGTQGSSAIIKSLQVSYKFFSYMMYGPDDTKIPLSVTEAFNTLCSEGLDHVGYLDPSARLNMYTNDDNTFFPAPVNITVKNIKK
jgi:hypothetical protein